MPIQLHTPATLSPVTLAEAKLHLRVELDVTVEDALIQAFIGAATLEAEHLMGRAIMAQKWRYTADRFDEEIVLMRPPVTAIDSVKYVEPVAGVLTEIDPLDYVLVTLSDYGSSVIPAYTSEWPSARDQSDAVQIVFSAGYTDAASVPAPIKTWIMLQFAAMYENRASEVIATGSPVKLGFVDSLLDRYRGWSL